MSGRKAKQHWTAGHTQADLAEAYAVSVDTVKNWAKQGMPGERGKYDLREVSQWLHVRGVGPMRCLKPDDDPLLVGDASDSPGLERYRQAKAALAEFELAQRQESLLSRDKAKAVLGRWAGLIRNMGERLGNRHGPEAAQAVNDALAECRRVIDYELGGTESTDADAAE